MVRGAETEKTINHRKIVILIIRGQDRRGPLRSELIG